MKNDIPIIVTRNKTKMQYFKFKIASPDLLEQIKLARNSSAPMTKFNQQPSANQTLEEPAKKVAQRTRRISSSAAAKKFPKDFFKDDKCLHIQKYSKSKGKMKQVLFRDTFSHKNFQARRTVEQINTNKRCIETPCFNKEKEKNVSKKIKITDFVSNKNIAERPSICNRQQQPKTDQIDNREILGEICQKPFLNISNFNLTLGQKLGLKSLMKRQKRGKTEYDGEKKENMTNCRMMPSNTETDCQLKVGGQGCFRIRRRVFG